MLYFYIRRDFIKQITNDKIRKLVSETYFINKVDRMTIDLLNQYAFILHENIQELKDEEINIARNYAENYLKKSNNWKYYDTSFELFVNKQSYQSMTDNNYELLEKDIFEEISKINNLINIDNWEYCIYYNTSYHNKLLLSKLNEKGYHDKISLIYDIENKLLNPCNIKLTKEMNKLSRIYQYYYNYDELEKIKI